ncbi:MAG: carbohydrate ABC transporter permease [Clostridia bacterium]|nr:carbohydrate ABC transporter permease [Clostridia bacterium]
MVNATTQAHVKSVSQAQRPARIAMHAFLILAALIAVFPVFIMISGSFKPITELFINSWGFPRAFTLDNYLRLLNYNSGMIMHSFMNSVFISASTTVLQLIVASMAGFAFSKYNFRGKNLLFMMFMLTMMVPGELLLTPQFIIFSRLGWLNSYQVQIIPAVANTFAMFMCRQFMDSIPNEMIEAARVDGAGHWRIYTQMILPTSVPTLGALGILQFLGKWNDYLYPRIMITKVQFKPIMVILPTLTEGGDTSGTPYDLILAGCTLVVIPMLIVFFALQDKFLKSVTLGSVKG